MKVKKLGEMFIFYMIYYIECDQNFLKFKDSIIFLMKIQYLNKLDKRLCIIDKCICGWLKRPIRFIYTRFGL